MHINPKVGLKGWLGNGGGIAPFALIAELEVEGWLGNGGGIAPFALIAELEVEGWLGNGGGIAPFALIAELEVEVETATTEVVAALMLGVHVVTMAAELVLEWVAVDEYG